MYAYLTRQHFLRLLMGMGVALPAAMLLKPAMAATAAVGKVTKVKGTVSRLRDGAQVVLKGGEDVAPGDVVTTLAESRLRISLADGSQLNLGELTKMTIAEFEFSPETLSRKATFDLKAGLCQATTAKVAGGSSFVIRTQNAVAATRSTEWIVETQKAQTSVYVLEGKVDVAESALGFRSLSSAEQDKAMLLGPGQFTTVGKMSLGGSLGPKQIAAKKLGELKAALD